MNSLKFVISFTIGVTNFIPTLFTNLTKRAPIIQINGAYGQSKIFRDYVLDSIYPTEGRFYFTLISGVKLHRYSYSRNSFDYSDFIGITLS